MQSISEVKERWQVFYHRPWPKGYELEVADVCLATLDSFAAGCISTFVRQNGRLDDERIDILNRCLSDLRKALPHMEGEQRAYFEELAQLVELCLRLLSR